MQKRIKEELENITVHTKIIEAKKKIIFINCPKYLPMFDCFKSI